MPFNDLHTDIIEIIFYIHVHIHQGSRRSLLLTCHRWHSVAISYTSLWRSIVWCWLPSNHGNPARCDSIRGLAHLIARTGNTSFDLSLGWWRPRPTTEEIDHFISSVGPNWISRCRSFTLTRDQPDFHLKEMNDLLLRGSFDKLERLTWNHSDRGFLNFELGRLIDHLRSTAPRLRELEIECALSANSVLSQLPCILGRIRRLRVATHLPLLALGSHLTNIEHLNVYGNPELFTTLLSPHLTSLGLKGRLLVSMLPPIAMLEKLTHLTIQNLQVPESRETSLYLPSLQYLSFQFSYYSYSGVLHAEKLKELTLGDKSDAQERILRFGPGVAPRIVNLYMPYDGPYQLQSLDYPLWIQMVELHVTMYRTNSGIAATVIVALEAVDFAPQLQCLTVRYEVEARRSGGVPQSQKREWVDQLLRLMAGRVAKGMKPFERLEMGWFDQLYYGYNPLDEFTEHGWITHWTDCLRG